MRTPRLTAATTAPRERVLQNGLDNKIRFELFRGERLPFMGFDGELIDKIDRSGVDHLVENTGYCVIDFVGAGYAEDEPARRYPSRRRSQDGRWAKVEIACSGGARLDRNGKVDLGELRPVAALEPKAHIFGGPMILRECGKCIFC